MFGIRSFLDGMRRSVSASVRAGETDLLELDRLRTRVVVLERTLRASEEADEHIWDETKRLKETLRLAEARIADLTGENLPKAAEALEELTVDQPPTSIVFYSTFHFSKDTVVSHGVFRLFSVPLGCGGQGKEHGLDKADTNIREGGRLPFGVLVHGLVVEVLGGSERDTKLMRETAALAWDRVQYALDIGPLGAFNWDSNGRRGALRLADPVSAAAGDPFSVCVQFGRTDKYIEQATRLRVSLLCTEEEDPCSPGEEG
jgi:hypothetical protein